MTSQYAKDLTEWFTEAKRQKSKYLVVVCDTFDLKQVLHKYNQNMQEVDHVFEINTV